jgi:hypothetical protein
LEKLLRSPQKPKKEVKNEDSTPARSQREPIKAIKAEQPATPKRTPKKTTPAKSPYFITDRVDQYNTTASSRRVPAGTSIVPVPPLTSTEFGIVQEQLWKEPFWLLIAVTFLNKTAGRSAMPIFWNIKKKFPTPEKLAEADPEEILRMVESLGLQNARSQRIIRMAKAWTTEPPVQGKAFRTLHYPAMGDGRATDVPAVVEEDMSVCKGAIEIGNMPGCGPYAYDSWRIFCRDVLRGVAQDYDGKGAEEEYFEAEWKRVLPGDKELRACLQWMWMREGVIWDPLTGARRGALEEEMEMAREGNMEVEDEKEVDVSPKAMASHDHDDVVSRRRSSVPPTARTKGGEESDGEREAQYGLDEDDSEYFTPPSCQGSERSD